MKNAILLLALTGMLAACEDPFAAPQANDQNATAAQAADVVDGHDHSQDQDQDRSGNGGN